MEQTIIEELTQYMKPEVDIMESVKSILEQVTSEYQGVRMRIPMMMRMLETEANLPQGMTMTRKAPGGSVTAAIKREFGLKKGLSKKKTAYAFYLLCDASREVYESWNNHPEVSV